MTDRRPTRTRKSVNYSGFEDCSDDDFADSTPPPSKKTKSTKTSEKSQKCEQDSESSESGNKTSTSGKQKRTSLSDKYYEQELRKAMQLSLIETAQIQEVAVVHKHSERDKQSSSNAPPCKLQDTSVLIEAELFPPHSNSSTSNSKAFCNGKLIETIMDDSIYVLEDKDIREKVNKKTKAKRPLLSEDEDEEENFESSSSDSEDSDFNLDDKHTDKKTKKKSPPSIKRKTKILICDQTTITDQKQKSETLTKKKSDVQASSEAATCSKIIQSKTTPSTEKKGVAIKNNGTVASSAHHSTVSSSAHHSTVSSSALTSGWKPPAMSFPGCSNSSISLKSPTTGLRLGLSRNQSIKPLHKTFKIT